MGIGNYKSSIDNQETPQYKKWHFMMIRCYSEKYLLRKPTYKDCFVCEEWHNFQNFAKWYDDNYYEIPSEKMELDKDILIKNNKEYSPNTCCFVPSEINVLFTKNNSKRGDYPIGVIKHSNTYGAKVSLGTNKVIYKGKFKTPEDAFGFYKTEKEKYIKEVADKYKRYLPDKLYLALQNYTVDIND